jgi:ribonuclease-3
VGKKEQKPLKDLIDKLGVNFKDKSLLDKALLHRSYSSEHAIAKDNERLEFLGDSILNASVTIMLFKMFPDKDEGDLTKIKAKLVSR